MSPIQQMLLGVGAKKSSVFVDDVFSTYLYTGNETNNHHIQNSVDLTEGGLVWMKDRGSAENHLLVDSEFSLPSNKYLISNLTGGGYSGPVINSFETNGFKLHSNWYANQNNHEYASWSFRKAPGFFDVVKYTPSGGTNTISHNLGCVPGMIIVKNLDTSDNWAVFHRGMDETNPNSYGMKLNTDGARFTGANWNVTATTFDAAFSLNNNDGSEHIAYLFAGGKSTQNEAVSVDFDGNDSLTIASSSGTNLGGGDFTLECWFKDDLGDTSHDTIFSMSDYTSSSSNSSFVVYSYNLGIKIFDKTGGSFTTKTEVDHTFTRDQWTHFAWTRSGSGSNNNKIWINGTQVAQFTGTVSYSDGQKFYIGANDYSGNGTANEYALNGKISNVRITKGQAIYTSSFRVSYEPLTTTTGGATASNVKVICCNNSSVTGSSLTSGTITSTGDPTASTDSPFDDPAAFKFGDSEEGIIKCGSYEGNHNDDGTEVFLGFEPSLLLIKSVDTADDWVMFDNLRGMTADGINDQALFPNTNDAESGGNYLTPTSTGFKLTTQSDRVNNESTYIFLALRRSDGYVGKPIEDATKCFAIDTGAGSWTIPNFDSGFPVDMGLYRRPAVTDTWYLSHRLLQGRYLRPNLANSDGGDGGLSFDSNVGWAENGKGSEYQSWQWKRHKGFTTVAYEGDGVAGRQIAHDMNKTVEMLWLKNRSSSSHNWMCYHKGLNGGTNPEDYFLRLNTTDAEGSSSTYLNSTAPTSTHITLGSINAINADGNDYIAMLFASVDKISKVGYYSGQATELTITTGFAPRFLIIRRINGADNWWVFDTTRGWASGNNSKLLVLDNNYAESTEDFGAPTSTGFTLVGDSTRINAANNNYIYYCHA